MDTETRGRMEQVGLVGSHSTSLWVGGIPDFAATVRVSAGWRRVLAVVRIPSKMCGFQPCFKLYDPKSLE